MFYYMLVSLHQVLPLMTETSIMQHLEELLYNKITILTPVFLGKTNWIQSKTKLRVGLQERTQFADLCIMCLVTVVLCRDDASLNAS